MANVTTESKGIKVNITNSTIIITKGFEKKASKYGTNEYNTLQRVKWENPDYKVEVRTDHQ